MFLILNKRHLYGGAAGHQSFQHGAIRYERIYWRPTLSEVLKTNKKKDGRKICIRDSSAVREESPCLG